VSPLVAAATAIRGTLSSPWDLDDEPQALVGETPIFDAVTRQHAAASEVNA
jgi:3-isopropylmalate/(R)-2-methylmalate dehydratase large subunit